MHIAASQVIVRQFVHVLDIFKLLQVKLVHLALDHCSYCSITNNALEQDKCGHDDGDGTFQWRDYCRFVKQQEKHKWRLHQQGEQPETSQFRHLINNIHNTNQHPVQFLAINTTTFIALLALIGC